MPNHNIILVSGKSATGKSFSLRNIRDPTGVIYLGCEANKPLPFKAQFNQFTVIDPNQVPLAIQNAEDKADIHTIVIDSLSYLMDMYESVYVLTASDKNRRQAWGDYAQFFKKLMQQQVAASSKNIIFLAHTTDQYSESDLVIEVLVKVKGSLMNQGIESYFTNVISTKKMGLPKLRDYENPLLTTSDREKMLGFKYVFQTQVSKDTINDRIRAPDGLWKLEETFVDNDLQVVLDRLHAYYQ